MPQENKVLDLKSNIDIVSSGDLRGKRLERNQARKLVSKIVQGSPGKIIFSKHCLDELLNDALTTSDILNVLKSPDSRIFDEPDLVNGTYRYRLGTNNIMAVIAFVSSSALVVVTAWRIKK